MLNTWGEPEFVKKYEKFQTSSTDDLSQIKIPKSLRSFKKDVAPVALRLERQSSRSGESLSCEEVGKYRVSSWGDISQIQSPNSQRSRLLNRSDRGSYSIERSEIEKHIENLIFSSYGAEAVVYASMYLEKNERQKILKQLAYIVDQDYRQIGVFNDEHIRCKNRGSLWAFLLVSQEGRLYNGEVDAILLSYLELPYHLKENLGPRLVRNFINFDQLPAAWIVSNTLAPDRDGAISIQEFVFAEASFAQRDFEMAAAYYEKVFQANSVFSANALARLVETLFLARSRLQKQMLPAVQSMIVEAAGTDVERSLTKAEVLILVEENRFNDALELVFGENYSAKDNVDLKSESVHLILEKAFSVLEDTELSEFLLKSRSGDAYEFLKPNFPPGVVWRTLALGRQDLLGDVTNSGSNQSVGGREISLALMLMGGDSDVLEDLDSWHTNEFDLEEVEPQMYIAQREYSKAANSFAELGKDKDALAAATAAGDWGLVERIWADTNGSGNPPPLIGAAAEDSEIAGFNSMQQLMSGAQDVRNDILTVLGGS